MLENMIKSKRGSRSMKHFWTAIAILLFILFALWLVHMFLSRHRRREYFQGTTTTATAGTAATGTGTAGAGAPAAPEVPPKVKVNYYYLETCPFCVQFKPEWDKFVSMTAGKIETNMIDGKTQDRYKSFPTIEIIEVGAEPREYTGDRTAVAMMDYLSQSE